MLFFKASCTELLLGSEYTGSSKNIASFRQIYVPRPHLILSPIYIELMLQPNFGFLEYLSSLIFSNVTEAGSATGLLISNLSSNIFILI